jgi:phage tail sheath protein FI
LVRLLNTLPPSGAVAGAMMASDAVRGVWTAPANVRLRGIKGLTQILNDRSQVLLTDETGTGKSINALRDFRERGILIWGARTLDGLSAEWRYISVRRTAMVIGQSIKRALPPFVFEPNDANTWNRLRHLIENFLFGLWQQGALQGTKPEHAYVVHIGLGSTMTNDDVSNGLLKISVMIALLRPAEFLILTFQQKQRPAL